MSKLDKLWTLRNKYKKIISVLKTWSQKQDSSLVYLELRCRCPVPVSVEWRYLLSSVATNLLGRPKSFFRFIRKSWMHKIFRFILFYRITYDPFCFIKIKITFDRLGFMFV